MGVVKKLNNFQKLQDPTIQLDFTHFRKNTGNFENLQTLDLMRKTPEILEKWKTGAGEPKRGQNSFLKKFDKPETGDQNGGCKKIELLPDVTNMVCEFVDG